jgi:hypothetical protein
MHGPPSQIASSAIQPTSPRDRTPRRGGARGDSYFRSRRLAPRVTSSLHRSLAGERS